MDSYDLAKTNLKDIILECCMQLFQAIHDCNASTK